MDSFIRVCWLVEGRVILLTLQGEVSAAQLNDYDRNIITVFDSVQQPLCIIADLSGLSQFPSINDCMKLKSLRHEKLGPTIMIGAIQNRLLKFFMSAITTFLPVSYKDAENFEQAQKYVMQFKPDLPPISEWLAPADSMDQTGHSHALYDSLLTN